MAGQQLQGIVEESHDSSNKEVKHVAFLDSLLESTSAGASKVSDESGKIEFEGNKEALALSSGLARPPTNVSVPKKSVLKKPKKSSEDMRKRAEEIKRKEEKIKEVRRAAEVQARKQVALTRGAFLLQLYLIDHVCAEEWFVDACALFQPQNITDVVDERSAMNKCGNPCCGNTPDRTKANQKYTVSLSRKKVYDAQELSKYCTPKCLGFVKMRMAQTSEEPIHLRNRETLPGSIKSVAFPSDDASLEDIILKGMPQQQMLEESSSPAATGTEAAGLTVVERSTDDSSVGKGHETKYIDDPVDINSACGNVGAAAREPAGILEKHSRSGNQGTELSRWARQRREIATTKHVGVKDSKPQVVPLPTEKHSTSARSSEYRFGVEQHWLGIDPADELATRLACFSLRHPHESVTDELASDPSVSREKKAENAKKVTAPTVKVHAAPPVVPVESMSKDIQRGLKVAGGMLGHQDTRARDSRNLFRDGRIGLKFNQRRRKVVMLDHILDDPVEATPSRTPVARTKEKEDVKALEDEEVHDDADDDDPRVIHDYVESDGEEGEESRDSATPVLTKNPVAANNETITGLVGQISLFSMLYSQLSSWVSPATALRATDDPDWIHECPAKPSSVLGVFNSSLHPCMNRVCRVLALDQHIVLRTSEEIISTFSLRPPLPAFVPSHWMVYAIAIVLASIHIMDRDGPEDDQGRPVVLDPLWNAKRKERAQGLAKEVGLQEQDIVSLVRLIVEDYAQWT